MNRKYGSITPVVQKSKDGINWTAGRNVSLENFSKGKTEGMQKQNLKVEVIGYVSRHDSAHQ